MKLYDSIGPNPHVVRMFLAELGIEIEKVEVDLMGGENRQASTRKAKTDQVLTTDSGEMFRLYLPIVTIFLHSRERLQLSFTSRIFSNYLRTCDRE